MLPAEPENVAGRGGGADAFDGGSGSHGSDPTSSGRAGSVSVRIETERQMESGAGGRAGGWSFEVTIEAKERNAAAEMGETAEKHELTLSWPDYEYWSHGLASPSRVAEAVVRGVLLLKPGVKLPRRFDASTCRRWAGGTRLDAWMREHL